MIMLDRFLFIFFFFFQAEDGIRDVAVTGVQTCALPISPCPVARAAAACACSSACTSGSTGRTRAAVDGRRRADRDTRSEEHTSELQSRLHLVCRLLLEKKNHRQSWY